MKDSVNGAADIIDVTNVRLDPSELRVIGEVIEVAASAGEEVVDGDHGFSPDEQQVHHMWSDPFRRLL